MAINRTLTIGMVQINNSFSGQNYFPYSIGILQAYAETHLKSPEDYNFLLPIYKREPIDVCIEKMAQADIVCFSVYVWNIRMSLALAEQLKKRNPNTAIVFGGPQVPNRVDDFLRQHPFIDVTCHGEGEAALVDILENGVANILTRTWGDTPSVSYLKDDTVHTFTSRPRIKDMNDVPSPYLEGTFAPLMQAYPDERWIVMWETNRGCPFSCAYCDWGSATQSRVFKFDMDRLCAELNWFADHRLEFIFCADANFGMLPRDVDIAQWAARIKGEKGYPHALSVQNTKNATERSYEVQKILSDSGLNKGVTIALQSTDEDTLEAIDRLNISTESYQELQRRFTRDGVDTYTDIILALPGETLASFKRGICQVVANGQHNRIQFGNLSILPNAAMADPAYIEKYGLEIVECPVVNIHGSLASTDNDIIERQELVVATHSLSREEWVEMRLFSWTCALLYYNKILQIPLLLLNRLYRVPFSDLIEGFMNADEEHPTLCWLRNFLSEAARGIQSGGPEYLPSEQWLNIWWPPDELVLIELCTRGQLDAFYDEARQVLERHLQRAGVILPDRFLHQSVILNQTLMKLPFQTEDTHLNLSTNLWEVYQGARRDEDVPLVETPTQCFIDKTTQVWHDWQTWCREVIWWGNKKGAYLYQNETTTAPAAQIAGHF